MITTNSLSAFTPDIMLPRLPGQVAGVPPVAERVDASTAPVAPPTRERRLDAAPGEAPPPGRLPRGSLVDLRI